jgi:hypothetical protein
MSGRRLGTTDSFECGCTRRGMVLYLCRKHGSNLRRLAERSLASPWGPWRSKP